MVAGALLMIVGTQVLALGLCAHAYGTYFMGEKDPWFDRMRARFRLEHGLLLGGAFMVAGLVVGGGDRRHLDRPRLRRALRGAARRSGRRADHRRHADLLLLLPDQHPRPAPPPLSMRIAAVLAAALVAIAVWLALVLVESQPRHAGSNYVPQAGPIATIDGSGRHCQTGQVVPGDSGSRAHPPRNLRGPSPALPDRVDRRRQGNLVRSPSAGSQTAM